METDERQEKLDKITSWQKSFNKDEKLALIQDWQQQQDQKDQAVQDAVQNPPTEEVTEDNVRKLVLMDPTLARLVGGITGAVAAAPATPFAQLGVSALMAEMFGQGAESFNTVSKSIADPRSFGQQFEDATGVPVEAQMKDLGTRVKDAAFTIGTDMALGYAFSKVIDAPRRLGNIFKTSMNDAAGVSTAQIADDFKQIDVTPTASAVGSKITQDAANMLENLPQSSRIMLESIEKTRKEMGRAYEKMWMDIGDPKSKEEVGMALQNALSGPNILGERVKFLDEVDYNLGEEVSMLVKNKGKETSWIDKMKGIQASLYNRAIKEAKVPEGVEIDLPETKRILQEIVKPFKENPQEVPIEVRRILKSIEKQRKPTKAKVGTTKGKLTFEEAAALKKKTGELINVFTTDTGLQAGDRKRIWGALKNDLDEAINKFGGKEATDALKKANDFTILFSDKKEMMKSVMEAKQTHKAFDAAFRGSDDSPQLLREVRAGTQGIAPGSWKDVVAHNVQLLGKAKDVEQGVSGELVFSPLEYVKSYGRQVRSGAADVLYDNKTFPGLRENLDKLFRVSVAFEKSHKSSSGASIAAGNVTSNILQGKFLGQAFNLAAGSGTGAAAISGSVPGIAAGATALAAPHYVAKLFTNTDFVKWLVQGASIKPTNYQGVGNHLGRLVGIAANHPDDATALMQLLTGYRDGMVEMDSQRAQRTNATR